MGIKKKKNVAIPHYPERWQNLAIQPERLAEARGMYRESNPKVPLVQAHRTVSEFVKEHKRKYG